MMTGGPIDKATETLELIHDIRYPVKTKGTRSSSERCSINKTSTYIIMYRLYRLNCAPQFSRNLEENKSTFTWVDRQIGENKHRTYAQVLTEHDCCLQSCGSLRTFDLARKGKC